jgi:NADH:ubiquinone oxidoreductase subunit
MEVVRALLNFFGYDKLQRLSKTIVQNGGFRKTFAKGFRMDDIKSGKLVGADKYGNKYFENQQYFFGRSRWVEYAEYKNLEYDASQVPPEWFGWLHYRTDAPPESDPIKLHAKYKWMLDHSENLSGTTYKYMPYDTTQPKIKAWDPNNVNKK